MKDGKIKLKNDKGEILECDVLFTFDSDETHKSYIAYTDNTLDESGNVKVYASTYNTEGEDLVLKPLETEKEWKVIENILASVQEQVKETLNETLENDESSDNDGEA